MKTLKPGQQIRNWTVISADEKIPKNWICQCFCGKEKSLQEIYLKRKGINSISCGCKRDEAYRQLRGEKAHGFKHGMWKTRVYRIWSGMLGRCTNPTNSMYPKYGGNNITICERWKSFTNFLEDMKEPTHDQTIDRIDGTKGYFKENCRWATHAEQQRNIKTNIYIEYKGETKILMDWSLELNINYQTLYTRLKKGLSTKQAFETPIQTKTPKRN